jgi:hypothetical protein
VEESERRVIMLSGRKLIFNGLAPVIDFTEASCGPMMQMLRSVCDGVSNLGVTHGSVVFIDRVWFPISG